MNDETSHLTAGAAVLLAETDERRSSERYRVTPLGSSTRAPSRRSTG